ncbi:MAG: iron-containing alcohol dehydrogenase [Intestinibacillus sp.]
MQTQRFTIPRDIYVGSGAVNKLKELKGNRALIVIGSQRLIKDGTAPKVQALLKEAGIASEVFSGIEADPTVATVKTGAEKMLSYQPDLIVGIGGGSPIDAAKAMWIFYEYPELTFEQAAKPFSLPELRRKARFIAIPTTSGTGTEVTSFSVISDTDSNIKYPIADYNITPDIALVDTDMVSSMTPTLIANTGMDALTHAIEAYVSTARNPITDALAMRSIEMTVRDVVNSYEGDSAARENMHISQCMAGMAFSNAILGIVHSMAHKTGRLFGIPHGCANAIYLPYCIQYNAKDAAPIYADIARRLHLVGSTDQELTDNLVALVEELRRQMSMPATMKDFGVDETFFLEHLDAIAEGAVGDPCTGTNPRSINPSQMRELFLSAYYGKKVDF